MNIRSDRPTAVLRLWLAIRTGTAEHREGPKLEPMIEELRTEQHCLLIRSPMPLCAWMLLLCTADRRIGVCREDFVRATSLAGSRLLTRRPVIMRRPITVASLSCDYLGYCIKKKARI
jgi:hypothetical protein